MSQAEDPVVSCPLDSIHRIRTSRLQFHLVRCMKNHTLALKSKVRCPFNQLHIVEAVEIMHHCRTCPDSGSVLLEQYNIEGEKGFKVGLTFHEAERIYDENVPLITEWDKPILKAPAYDPKLNIENKPVYRSLCCESKAKRREFRMKERQRFAALENKEKAENPVEEVTKVPEETTLRRPNFLTKEVPNNYTPAHSKSIESNENGDEILEKLTKKPMEEKIKKKIISSTNEGEAIAEKDKNRKGELKNLKSNLSPSKSKNNDVEKSSEIESEIEIAKALEDISIETVDDAVNQLKMYDNVLKKVKDRRTNLLAFISSNKTKSPEDTSSQDVAVAKAPAAAVDTKIITKKSPRQKCAANFNISGGQSADVTANSKGVKPKMRLPNLETLAKMHNQ